jgi:hypothetical protein
MMDGHDIAPGDSVENLNAMTEAAERFGKLPGATRLSSSAARLAHGCIALQERGAAERRSMNAALFNSYFPA